MKYKVARPFPRILVGVFLVSWIYTFTDRVPIYHALDHDLQDAGICCAIFFECHNLRMERNRKGESVNRSDKWRLFNCSGYRDGATSCSRIRRSGPEGHFR